MGHDGVVILQEFLAPYRLKKLLGRDYNALPLTEIPEDGKLNGSQLQLISKQKALMTVPVDYQSPYIILAGWLPPALLQNDCKAGTAAAGFLHGQPPPAG